MSSLVVFGQAPGGEVLRSAVGLAADGVPPAAAALEVAAEVLKCFGLVAPNVRVRVTGELGPNDGAVSLATAVLLVAEGLGRPVQPRSVVATRLASTSVERISFQGPELLDRLAPEDECLLLDDERVEVGKPSQAEVVRGLLRERLPTLRVNGVTSLEQVLSVLLGGPGWLQSAGPSQDAIRRAAAHLFALVVHNARNLLDWDAVVAITRGQLMRAEEDGTREAKLTRWKLAFARDVARRHCGESILTPWAEDDIWASFSSAERLAIAAHIVQGAADGDARMVPITIDFAMETLEVDGHSDQGRTAALWGAMGRAHASVGEFGEAIAALTRACKAWRELGLEQEMSYSACELLRVATRSLIEAGEWARLCGADPRTGPDSMAFLHLAEGRAAAEVGDSAGALAKFDDLEAGWRAAPQHARLTRLRWRHYALLRLKRGAEASETLRELEREGESDQLCLARLDLALEGGGDWREPLEELIAVIPEGKEALRTLERIGSRPDDLASLTREDARRLAAEYRY